MEKDEAKRLAEQGWYFRHACKVFTDQKVSEADFSYILNAARFSPSSFGLEPWRFVVLQNPQMREALVPFCWGARRQLPTCSHFVIVLARKDVQYDSDYVRRTMKEIHKITGDTLTVRMDRYQNFQRNDFKLLESKRAMFDWACKQCYIALAMMMQAAAIIAIDSCPIEGFDREQVEAYLTEQGVYSGEEYGIACMVSFGYRFAQGREKTRHRLDDIVQWVY